tara:strand:+ start:322 stop:1119 length:798 start_codon:yes stop_codon:yes gene_type:complete
MKSAVSFRNKNPYYNNPFGKSPLASKDEYLSIWEDAKIQSYPMIDEYEKNMNHKIDINWFHELALHTQVVIKKSRICYQHGRVLFSTLCNYLENNSLKNINILDVGTARGFSAVVMASALKKMNVKGEITTIDPLPHHHKMYWNCIDDLERKKSRSEILSGYEPLIDRHIKFLEGEFQSIVKGLSYERLHFAFIDAIHEYESVMFEFKYINQFQKLGDVIIFDDYNDKLFPGVVKAVDEICQDYNYTKKVINANNQRGYVVATKY